eukprot:TRINITY_DN16924_c0_g1_i1.p1 TRINITY_DN16924_c0_g1~~TRINITY_DN16924_c0_g1_i1.p1  ORF type:complete len:149 (+),score=42.81 TRINITY_DN16924_c0_g1_i1:47-493(+)
MSAGYDNIVKDSSTDNWVIVAPNGESLRDVATGNGLSALQAALDPTQIQFAVLKIFANDDSGSRRAKFVLVNWVGSKVPPMKRMTAIQAKSTVAATFNNITIFKDINNPSELTLEDIAKDLFGCGGAHKPSEYDFGNGEVFSCEAWRN